MAEDQAPLTPEDEQRFQAWYQVWAAKAGLDANPDAPEHRYDYRAAFQAGAEPEVDPADGRYHWPSEFKSADHPNRYVPEQGPDKKWRILDSTTGRPVEPRYPFERRRYDTESQAMKARDRAMEFGGWPDAAPGSAQPTAPVGPANPAPGNLPGAGRPGLMPLADYLRAKLPELLRRRPQQGQGGSIFRDFADMQRRRDAGMPSQMEGQIPVPAHDPSYVGPNPFSIQRLDPAAAANPVPMPTTIPTPWTSPPWERPAVGEQVRRSFPAIMPPA